MGYSIHQLCAHVGLLIPAYEETSRSTVRPCRYACTETAAERARSRERAAVADNRASDGPLDKTGPYKNEPCTLAQERALGS